MFKNLQESIKALNADVKTVANCEKAKKLRKKLLTIGLILSICGYLGVFICFILFVTAGSGAFSSSGFTPRILIPFILFVPCGFIGGLGSMITTLGLKIVITGYTSDLIDETVGNNCPTCGSTIDLDAYYCTKCGTKIKIECPNCKKINSYKNNYCESCGTKLN